MFRSRTIKIKYLAWALVLVCAGFFSIGVDPVSAGAQQHYYVTNPTDCPKQNLPAFPGQGCTDLYPNQCGVVYGATDAVQCYDNSTMVKPGGTALSETMYDSITTGGYIIDCYAAADAGSPFCNNDGAAWCNADNTCQNTNHKKTLCAANKWNYEGSAASCDASCTTGYQDCDVTPSVCEVQTGVTNCAVGSNNNIGAACTCQCDSGYVDCNASGPGGGDGCEIQIGGTCSIGGLIGSWDASCTCVVPTQHFITGINAQFSTTSPLLWGTQYGAGNLLTLTTNNITTSSFIVSNAGQMGIGVASSTNLSAETSVALDVSSTARGVLLPRLTTAQRTAISGAPAGLLLYDSTENKFYYNDGSSWKTMGGAVEASTALGNLTKWTTEGKLATTSIQEENGGYLGIGTSPNTSTPGMPPVRLAVNGQGVLGYYQRDSGVHDFAIFTGTNGPYTGTMIGSLSSSTLYISVSTSPVITALTNGNVGVGTTNPSSGKLQVNGGISSWQFAETAMQPALYNGSHAGIGFTAGSPPDRETTVVYGYGNSTGTLFRVAAKPFTGTPYAAWDPTANTLFSILGNGNVGIGSTAPGWKLDIALASIGDGTGWRTTRGTSVMENYQYNNSDGFIGMASVNSLNIITSDTPRITIDAGGNVGIGTTAPGVKLEIQKNQAATTSLKITNTNAAGVTSLILGDSLGAYTAASIVRNQSNNNLYLNAYSGSIIFNTYNDTPAAEMVIDTAGNVGIGTALPQAKLSVNGSYAIGISDTVSGGYGAGAIGWYGDATGDSALALGSNIQVSGNNSVGIGLYDTVPQQVVSQSNLFAVMAGNVGIGYGSGVSAKLAVNGNVGIGTSAATALLSLKSNNNIFFNVKGAVGNSILRAYETGNDAYLDIKDSSGVVGAHLSGYSASSSYFMNNVGIGSTNPGSILDILAPSGDAVVNISPTITGGESGLIQINGDTSGGGVSALLLLANSALQGGLSAEGDGINLTAVGVHPLVFNTNANERMRITGAGNVGIGANTTPPAKLYVESNNAYNDATGFQIEASGSHRTYISSDNANGVSVIQAQHRAFLPPFSYGASTLAINPSGGNVGIGTYAPSSMLEVQNNGTKPTLQIGHYLSGTGDDSFIFGHGYSGVTPFVNNVADSFMVAFNTTVNGTVDPALMVTGAGVTTSVSINYKSPPSHVKLYSYRGSGDEGAGYSSIYGYRLGESGATHGGSSFLEGSVDAAIKGSSYYGNNYTVGVGGYNYLDYNYSAGVMGSDFNNYYYTALAYKDGSGTEWSLYANDNAYFGGNIGIGTTATAVPLNINVASDGVLVNFSHAGSVEGNISVSGLTVTYNAFTGSHFAWTDTPIEQGLVVAMDGNNKHSHNDPAAEIIYGITTTKTANDPKVLGSFLGKVSPFVTSSVENPYLVMAAGNGDMWVADNGENIEAGDYLISSNVEGHAMKDLGTFDSSYIFARASEAIDWSTVTTTIGGVKHKKIIVLFESFVRDNRPAKAFTIDTNARTISVGSALNPYDLKLTGLLEMSSTTLNKLSFTTTTLFESSIGGFSGARAFVLNALNFNTTSADTYILSLRSNNESRFSVSSNGDVHAAGNYYGASAVLGTSTNPGDLAEKVDININDNPEPGDVMVVDPDNADTYKISRTAYDSAVAGVISTNPTIIVGNGKTSQTAVMAMVGRVPVKVSTENGAITRGDLLVAASTTGYAMKYDQTKDDNIKMVGVIGIALENFDSASTTTGIIMALIRTGWVYNKNQTIITLQQHVQTIASVEGINLNSNPGDLNVGGSGGPLSYTGGNLDLGGSSLLNVDTVVGKENKWKISSDGVFIARIASDNTTNKKEVYGLSSTDVEVQISSSSILNGSESSITLPEDLQNIISTSTPIKVLITFTAEPPTNGYFIADKTYQGFKLKTVGGQSVSTTFDWLVIARRRGYDMDTAAVIPTQAEESLSGVPAQSGQADTSTPPVGQTVTDTSTPSAESTPPPTEPTPPPAEPTPPPSEPAPLASGDTPTP